MSGQGNAPKTGQQDQNVQQGNTVQPTASMSQSLHGHDQGQIQNNATPAPQASFQTPNPQEMPKMNSQPPTVQNQAFQTPSRQTAVQDASSSSQAPLNQSATTGIPGQMTTGAVGPQGVPNWAKPFGAQQGSVQSSGQYQNSVHSQSIYREDRKFDPWECDHGEMICKEAMVPVNDPTCAVWSGTNQNIARK